MEERGGTLNTPRRPPPPRKHESSMAGRQAGFLRQRFQSLSVFWWCTLSLPAALSQDVAFWPVHSVPVPLLRFCDLLTRQTVTASIFSFFSFSFRLNRPPPPQQCCSTQREPRLASNGRQHLMHWYCSVYVCVRVCVYCLAVFTSSPAIQC